MNLNDLTNPETVPGRVALPSAAIAQKHPRGLSTLFFTEMWERFSYYGMRALLVLFMVDAVRGGMGMNDKVATSIYGLYTAAVYLMSLPGGWLSDRLWGAQRAVWIGGIIIALGQFTLAFSSTHTFYLGLILVVIGSGTLKPNMSGLVAELYPEGGSRRDAGFTIFYMGVNLGAFLGPLVCGWLAEKYGWHYGFCAPGVGMLLGLLQFRLTRHRLGQAGRQPVNPNPLHPVERFGLLGAVIALLLTVSLGLTGVLVLNPVVIARFMTYVILGIATVYFLYLFLFYGLNHSEKQRVGMILVLFFASALFWAGFEQAGSSFNLFAERYTDRQLNWVGLDVQYGSPLLSEGSFKDPTMAPFIARLEPPADAVSTFLAARLSPETQKELAKHQAGGSNLVTLQTNLLTDLNTFIKGDSLFDAGRFSGVHLRPKTTQLLAGHPKGEELRSLNRRLLEDAYPLELSMDQAPASWFQALGPIFIIMFAPLFAWLWVSLARRNLDPSIPVKFAFGLLLLAAGFLIMAGAARIVAAGHKVWPTWLIMTYLVHTFGELCLSPVGLSSVTKLAPRRLVGQLMGTWFLATSLGNLIAGLLAGQVAGEAVSQMPGQFLKLVFVPVGAGMVLLLLAKPIARLSALGSGAVRAEGQGGDLAPPSD